MKRAILFCIGVAALLTCAQRDGDILGRTNPFDPNGDDPRYGQPPVISIVSGVPARWVSFDSATAKGSLRMSFSAWDPDEAGAVECTILVSRDSSTLFSAPFVRTADTVITIPGVTRSEKLFWAVVAKDTVGSVTTLDSSVVAPPLPPPPAVTNLFGSSSGKTITLSWWANQASSYTIYRSGASTGPYDSVGSTTSTYWSDVQGADGFYYYLVASTNVYGDNIARDTVWAQRYTASMSGPTSVSASPYEDYIWVYWSSYLSSGQSAIVLRSRDSLGIYLPIKTVTDDYQYYDTVTTGDRYFYRVYFVSANGTMSQVTPPSGGANITGGYGPDYVWIHDNYYRDSIVVHWSCMPGILFFRVYKWKAGATDTTTFDMIPTGIDSCRYRDVVGADTASYYYAVSAYEMGILSRKTQNYNLVSALRPPLGVLVDTTGTTDSMVSISFSTRKPGVYRLYHSTDSVAFTLVDTTQVTSSYTNEYNLSDTLDPSSIVQRNYYQVRFYNDSSRQESRPSPTVRGIVRPSPPSKPARATPYIDSVVLSWGKAQRCDGYRIYRSSYGYSSKYQYRLVATIKDSLDTSFIVLDSLDTTMYYTVVAFNRTGESLWNSQYPAEVQALRIPSEAVSVYTDGGNGEGVLLYWDPVNDARTYFVYRVAAALTPDQWDKQYYALLDSTRDTVYFDSTTSDSLYYYLVGAGNELGRGPIEGTHSRQGRRSTPKVPDSLWVSKGTYDNAIHLQWTRPIGADTFAIFRSLDNQLPNAVLVGRTIDTSYNNVIAWDTAYYYWVKGINELGTGEAGYNSTYAHQGFRKPQTLPDTVAGFQATTRMGYVALTWAEFPYWAQTFNGFIVSRSAYPTGPWTAVDTVTAESLAGRDETSTAPYCPEKAWYAVVKYNVYGAGPRSQAIQSCRN